MSSSAGKMGCLFSSDVASFSAGGGCADASKRSGLRELGASSLEIISVLFGGEIDLEVHVSEHQMHCGNTSNSTMERFGRLTSQNQIQTRVHEKLKNLIIH